MRTAMGARPSPRVAPPRGQARLVALLRRRSPTTCPATCSTTPAAIDGAEVRRRRRAAEKKSMLHRYRFDPEQEHKIGVGASVVDPAGVSRRAPSRRRRGIARHDRRDRSDRGRARPQAGQEQHRAGIRSRCSSTTSIDTTVHPRRHRRCRRRSVSPTVSTVTGRYGRSVTCSSAMPPRIPTSRSGDRLATTRRGRRRRGVSARASASIAAISRSRDRRAPARRSRGARHRRPDRGRQAGRASPPTATTSSRTCSTW